jgi:MYXO-CTERM domain-containing protein
MAPATDRQRAAQWFRPGYPDQHMRVSDADRSDIADRLARHYGDGRLDQAEFDDRIGRAMAAKTVADFQGLFEDLPDLPQEVADATGKAPGSPSAPSYMGVQKQRPRHTLLGKVVLVALVLIALSIGWHAATDWWFHPWMWIAAIVLVVLAARRRRRSR